MTRGSLPVVVIAVLLAALFLFDGADPSSPQPGATDPGPVADADGVLTSSWFCPSPQGGPASDLTTAIDVANTTATARTGTVTWYAAADGTASAQPFTVAAGSVRRLRATESGPTPTASALVETDGGGVVVEHVVGGARGSAVAPCSSDASAEWYLANGSTLVDATEVLALFNPFAGDAVIDIEFATGEGRQAPGSVQGYVVPARTTRFVNVGGESAAGVVSGGVRREEITASAIRARTGRLVVTRLQSFDGTQGRSGISLALAARAAADSWSFADGVVATGGDLRWHIFNPGTSEAAVSIEVMPESGDTPEPIDLTLPPRSQVVVHSSREGGVARGVFFASVVRSSNGVPIVVERSVDFRAPDPHRGWTSTIGSPVAARRWSFASGDSSATGDEWLSVFNPGAEPRRFAASSLTPAGAAGIPKLEAVVVAPAGRVQLRLADYVQAPQLGLLVEADGAVVVERSTFGVGLPGATIVAGVRLVDP